MVAARPPRRRPWLQFKLRTFLVALLVPAAGLAWFAALLYRVHTQRQAVRRVESLGGQAHYGYMLRWDGTTPAPVPPGPRLLRWAVGDDVYAHVTAVTFGLQPISDDELSVLKELPQVNKLVGRFSMDGLNHLAGSIRLRGLNVRDSSITAVALANSRVTSGLESLTLSGATVNDAALTDLDKLKKLDTLQVVDAAVTDKGLESVSAIENLRSLDLFWCGAITDAGVAHLKDLKHLRHLGMVGLSITEDGLTVLRHLPQLESLDLSGLPLTSEGMQLLGDLRSLRAFNLRACQVTDEGAEHLSS